MRHRRGLLVVVVALSAALALTGCEAFRKKFTRKRARPEIEEPMVITPRDYDANPIPPSVLYKQYFTYWKAWNDELMTSLQEQASHAKIVSCVTQSLVNLNNMRNYLADEQASALDAYVVRTEKLKADLTIRPNMLPNQYASFRYEAEMIYRGVSKKFDLGKMSKFLKEKS